MISNERSLESEFMGTPRYDMIGQLRNLFPEVEGRYQEEIRSWGPDSAPGDGNIIGFVFKPLVRDELKRGVLSDFLVRVADFMEMVCTSGDIDAINVVWLKLFKLLLAQPRDLAILWPVLGPATRLNLKDAANRWDLKRNLPDFP